MATKRSTSKTPVDTTADLQASLKSCGILPDTWRQKISSIQIAAPVERICYYRDFSTPWSRAEAEDTRPDYQLAMMRHRDFSRDYELANGGGIKSRGSTVHSNALVCAHSTAMHGSAMGRYACIGGVTINWGTVSDRAETNGRRGGHVEVLRGGLVTGYSKAIADGAGSSVVIGGHATLAGSAEIIAMSTIRFTSGVIRGCAKVTDFIAKGSSYLRTPVPFEIIGATGAMEIGGTTRISSAALLRSYFMGVADNLARLEGQQ